ncbi:hypothetical protein ACFV0T_20225 [Streptomyces sp. NPDC059582]|uniref:hypothetical protein n=1 Tax=Streptomyces sp. NPDC059582 TaxID=3346875 RepID=UPI0036CBCE5D
MSDTPEAGETLSQRVEAHRAALASLLAPGGLDPSPVPPMDVASRADVLISATDDPWHDGSGRDSQDDEEEKAESE